VVPETAGPNGHQQIQSVADLCGLYPCNETVSMATSYKSSITILCSYVGYDNGSSPWCVSGTNPSARRRGLDSSLVAGDTTLGDVYVYMSIKGPE